jgi:hypothetical protein
MTMTAEALQDLRARRRAADEAAFARLEAKNLKQWEGRDGYGYTCTLYLDGKRAALVRQDGHGGCTDFDPVAYTPEGRAALAAVEALGAEWARARGLDERQDALDTLVAKILDEQDLRKGARTNAKKGFPVTVVIYKGRAPWAKEEEGDDPVYTEVKMIGLRSADAIPAILEREKPDAHRVIVP